MSIRKTFFILVIVIFITSCNAFSKCNDKLASNFQQTVVASFIEDYLKIYYGDQSISGMEWKISARGSEGCVVYLSTVINSVEHIEPVFYVELSTGRVFGDDETGKVLMRDYDNLTIEIP